MSGNLAEGGGQAKGGPDQQIGEAARDGHLGPEPDAAMLRWLRRLVTGLALAMGLGMLAVVAVVWARLGSPAPVAPPPAPPPTTLTPALPAGLTLPEGTTPAAVTFARDWLVVVTEGGEVLVYDRAGTLHQRLPLE